MILIDFLYYQFTNFYHYFEKDGTHKASGLILTCGFLCWNLTIIIILVDYFFKTNVGPSSKYFLLIYYLPIVFFICLRYWKFTSYEEVKEKVKNFGRTKKTIADILLIIYVIISLPGAIYIAAKLHSLNVGS